jgi:dienelactone hydrolase
MERVKHKGITPKDLKRLKKSFVLIVFLGFILALVYINRAQSYEKYERVQFESAGATLYANLYYPSKEVSFQGEGSPLLLYLHGLGFQRDFDLRIPVEFCKRGFYVVSIDYQGHGESGGYIDNVDSKTGIPGLAQDCSKLLDVLETLPFYENINTSQIGLLGYSLGGFTALMNQALDPRLNITVVWAPLVDPVGSKIPIGEPYPDYHPVNLLNSTNTQNLLIIAHVDDETVPHEKNAVVAQQLTGATLINITEPLLLGGHALATDIVLEETINWFEGIFFGSEVINGPIYLNYIWNYVFIALALLFLFLTTLTLISYSARYFKFEKASKQIRNEASLKKPSTFKKGIIIADLLVYFFTFIFIWVLFLNIFGLAGLFFGSLVILLIFTIGRLVVYSKKYRKEGRKFDLKEVVKSQLDKTSLAFSLISTGYFIGTYLAFSFIYPFAFVFPSNIFNFLAGLTAFPLIISMEILYRKLILPQLTFIEPERKRTKITILFAIIVHVILMIFTWSWIAIPVVFISYLIFLLVIILNSYIYESTHCFSSIVLSSFIVIQIFFGAIFSFSFGMGSVLHFIIP